MEEWSRDKAFYELSDKYFLTKAEPKEFAIYESVYGDNIYNRFAVKAWDLRLAISLDVPFAKGESYYWIKHGGSRIGGVVMEPNVLSRLFIIPPFMDLFEVLKLLKKLLIKWSDSNRNIYAFQISPEQAQYFERLGFWPDKSRRWMMRPTEAMDYLWDKDIIVKTPQPEDAVDIAELFYESFKRNIDSEYTVRQNGHVDKFADYLCEVEDYFNHCIGEGQSPVDTPYATGQATDFQGGPTNSPEGTQISPDDAVDFSGDELNAAGQVLNLQRDMLPYPEKVLYSNDNIFLKASTLIYDKTGKKLIGACIISCFEEWPLVHTICVHPSFRGRNLAQVMLKKALTILKEKYPVLRLFVTMGNPAEAVYYELGFVPGVEFKKYYIPGVKE